MIIDTHAHLDGEEFRSDLDEVITRAKAAGVGKVFIPGIDLSSVDSVLSVCNRYPGYCYPMLGLHPEEVRADWRDVLAQLKPRLSAISARPSEDFRDFRDFCVTSPPSPLTSPPSPPVIAIGEVGLDFYWSREFEQEQLLAFEEQVRWSIELHLPLMIHCRKAQNELVTILKKYKNDLCGGVFHCFTGNEIEARELLQFENFVLGIGGVLTFKKSNLPTTLTGIPSSHLSPLASHLSSLTSHLSPLTSHPVPLDRIVLETDCPYMAPVPHRGQRNEPAFVREVLRTLAACYHLSEEEVANITTANVSRLFPHLP